MTVLDLVNAVLLPCVVVYHGLTMAMLVSSASELRRLRRVAPELMAESVLASGELPPVSIVVPAFNEEVAIARTVESLLGLRYPMLEVIVVNDGSTDRTLEVLLKRFDLRPDRDEGGRDLPTQRVRAALASAVEPRLRVVDKRNGGKADALNAGINMARFPLVLAVDADVVLDRDALVHLAVPFLTDASTVATSGMIRPQNGCDIADGRLRLVGAPRRWLERIQVVEYLRAYGVGRMFFNRYNAHLIVSGAFGLFSRQVLLDLGGYQAHAVGEDMELIVRLHRRLRDAGIPYRVAFSPDALCLTEAPHTLRDLGGQRTRWHQGLLSTLRLHKDMVFNSRYGAAGLFACPYFVVELFYPFLEVCGWAMLPVLALFGVIGGRDVAGFVALVVLLGVAVSLAALVIDMVFFGFFERPRDRAALVMAAILEPFGYRQWTVFFRIRAFVRYYRTLLLRSAWEPPSRRTPASPVDEADAAGSVTS